MQSEELLVAKNFFNRRKAKEIIPDIVSVFRLLNTDMFPTLNSVFQVALTIPVRSCGCERSFSALRRLHTYLRNTMEQDRLNHLTVMSTEKDNLTAVDHDIIWHDILSKIQYVNKLMQSPSMKLDMASCGFDLLKKTRDSLDSYRRNE
ncbi:Zinc finger MYM-type protein 1 [Labeo rohita]|uniref:Zinc finger MYM-type protein 1 n=1 Tax=Labeo rohita TaxID=84645 RepID=A0ABQ8MSA2_LABRO|nr:Zinc finger MYM-type protein 1 [Labeo rohita]